MVVEDQRVGVGGKSVAGVARGVDAHDLERPAVVRAERRELLGHDPLDDGARRMVGRRPHHQQAPLVEELEQAVDVLDAALSKLEIQT